MKKRMWLWCLIAALGLSINVACESDDESEDIVPPTGGTPIVPPTGGEQTPLPSDSIPVPPSTEVIWVDTIQVPETEKTIGYEGGTVSFVTTTNQTYWIEVEKGVDWLTISDEGRAVKDYTIVATVEKNLSKNERAATITINFDDAENTSVDVKITQEGRPATATIEFEVECPNGPGYVNVSGQYNVAELIAGCDPDMEPQLGYENEEGEMVWQNWSVTDGWFGPDGPMDWGAGCIVCIKPNSDGSFNHISAYPGVDPTEIVVYINYGNDVILEVTAIITPEEVEETNEYTIVETITVERTVTFVPGHGIVPESYTLDMAAITEKIGGTPNEFLMSRPDGKFQDWSTTDGWFGEEGAVAWGSGNALKCLKPQADGTFADDCCHPDAEASLPIVANCTYRYGNTETMKAVDVKFAVTIQAEAEVVLPDFAITPEAGVVEVAADGAATYEAQIIAKDGYTLVKYIYDAQYGMTNIYSEYQECWYTIEEGENGKVEVTFEANAKPEARKAYLYAMPTADYEALNGDIDGFFVADQNASIWEPSEQAAQYLVAEFQQAAGEVDDTFEFDPMGEVVEVAADASTYFTATINCPAGYTLIKYDYTEWGMTNIYSEYQDFWYWVNDDKEGNIEVNFEINETASPRKAYLYVMPTSVYETLGGDIDGFFTDQSNPDLWEPSEQAAQYLVAEFHQAAGEVDDTFEINPMGEVVEAAVDGSSYFNATVNCPAGYTLVKYDYTEWGMTNIFSEYQEFWCYVEDDNEGNISVSFEANETASPRKAYLYAMPTADYEALNGDIDGFFTDQSNPDLWEPSEQAAQYLIAEFQQEAGEVDDTFEINPMGEVVEAAVDGSSYFNATVNCPAGYTLVKYDYTEWGMTNIFSVYQEFWCYVEDDNAGNISVSFEANETASARKAYLFAMPTSAYEALNGDVDGFFVADVNADVWEMSEQAAQYLIAEFQQEAGAVAEPETFTAANMIGTWEVSYTRTAMSATEYAGLYSITSEDATVGGTIEYTEGYTNAGGEYIETTDEKTYTISSNEDYDIVVTWMSREFGVVYDESTETMTWKYIGMADGAYASVTFSDMVFTK